MTLIGAAQPGVADGGSLQIAEDTVQGHYSSRTSAHIFIASAFSSDHVDTDARLDSVKDFVITGIELVYSGYRKVADFRQHELNNRRWQNLERIYPSLFVNGTAQCRSICQVGESSDTAARKMAHGFYIYYRNPADPEKNKEELSALMALMSTIGVDTSDAANATEMTDEYRIEPVSASRARSRFRKPMKAKDPAACRQPFYGEGPGELDRFFSSRIQLSKRQVRNRKKLFAEVRLRLDYNGIIRSAHVISADYKLIDQIRKALSEMQPWHPAVMRGVTVKSDVKFDLVCGADDAMHVKGNVTVHRNFAKCPLTREEDLFDFDAKEETPLTMHTALEVPDNSLLQNVVRRNTGLRNLMLVVDVTGSMAPYIAQVMRYMTNLVSTDPTQVCCVVLFNDGNGRDDHTKAAGRTGGITVLDRDITPERLGEAVMRSMRAGNGGDVMENNVEALLEGINKCGQCTDILMIADNWATPRDRALIEKVGRPVHWLLCGASSEVNPNYLDIIRMNKGTLHTELEDVADLQSISEGGVVTIAGRAFRLKGGQFKAVGR
jgi:hypothetical protein